MFPISVYSDKYRALSFLCFKREVLLCQVTEGNHNGGGNDFGNGWEQVEIFNEKADEKIIQENTDEHQEEIPEQLDTSLKHRIREHHVTHQHKSGWKTNEEGDDKGSNMRFECNKSQVQNLLVQNKIVGQEKNNNIKNCIKAPTGGITKALQRKNLSKRRIKKVNNRNDYLFWHSTRIPAAKLIETGQIVYPTIPTFALNSNLHGACSRHQTGRSNCFSR
jgi:hypothetical protein